MQPNDNRGIPEVVSETMDRATTLMQRELELFKAEMSAEFKKVGRGAGLLGVAGFSSLLAALFASWTVFFILDIFMWRWVAALIVAVIWGIVAATTAASGRAELEKVDPMPHRTAFAVRRDVQTMRSGMERDLPVVKEDARSRAQDAYDNKVPDSMKEKALELKDKAVDKLPGDVAAKLPDKVTEKDEVLHAKKRREEARNSDDGDPVIHPATSPVDPFTASTLGAYTYADPTPFDGNPFGGTDDSSAAATPDTVSPVEPSYGVTPVDPTPAPSSDPSPSTYDGGSTSSYDGGSSTSYDGGSSTDNGSNY